MWAVFLLRSLGRHPAPARSEPAAHRGLRASFRSGRPQPTPPYRGAGRRWPEAAPARPCVWRPQWLSCCASSEPPALGQPGSRPGGGSGCLGQGRLAASLLRFTPAAAAGGQTDKHLTSTLLRVCLNSWLPSWAGSRQRTLCPTGFPRLHSPRPQRVRAVSPSSSHVLLSPVLAAGSARPPAPLPSGGFHSQFSEAKLGPSEGALERLPSPPAAWPPQLSALTVARTGGPGRALVGAGQPRGPWRPGSLQCAGRSPGSRAWLAQGWRLVLLWRGGWDAAHAPGLLTGPGCLRVVSDPTSYLILTLQTLWGFVFVFFWTQF